MEFVENLTIIEPPSLFTPASVTHVKSAINSLPPERAQDKELFENYKALRALAFERTGNLR